MNSLASARVTWDVCVVGGGPAASAAAIRLARLGHTICLLERDYFPRRHVGESLTPNVFPLLDLLGVLPIVEQADFLHPRYARVRWGDDTTREQGWSGKPGLLVDRGRFDQILLDAAKEAGCRVIQPAMARRPSKAADGRWHVPLEMPDERLSLTTRFIIDAAGKRSYLGAHTLADSPRTLCLFAWWRAVGGWFVQRHGVCRFQNLVHA
jgi:flavin-dependent dehydrogenase